MKRVKNWYLTYFEGWILSDFCRKEKQVESEGESEDDILSISHIRLVFSDSFVSPSDEKS